VGADQTCVPSKCAAIENLGQHQVVLGSSCFENGVQAASQMPASSCILGCLDGYSATNIAAGICTADEGLPTASYQGQNVDCVPSQCTAPLITPPQVSIARPDAFLVSCDNIYTEPRSPCHRQILVHQFVMRAFVMAVGCAVWLSERDGGR
jgi:hypothetical protein